MEKKIHTIRFIISVFNFFFIQMKTHRKSRIILTTTNTIMVRTLLRVFYVNVEHCTGFQSHQEMGKNKERKLCGRRARSSEAIDANVGVVGVVGVAI